MAFDWNVVILAIRWTGGPPATGNDESMRYLCVPRHGKRPSPIPKKLRPDQTLPGAVKLSFFDGHAELVPLERLWSLYWHRDYKPPEKRPGLK